MDKMLYSLSIPDDPVFVITFDDVIATEQLEVSKHSQPTKIAKVTYTSPVLTCYLIMA